ncbi:unnamed protein product, partial [Ectocarpus sp. 4 AP-2014]
MCHTNRYACTVCFLRQAYTPAQKRLLYSSLDYFSPHSCYCCTPCTPVRHPYIYSVPIPVSRDLWVYTHAWKIFDRMVNMIHMGMHTCSETTAVQQSRLYMRVPYALSKDEVEKMCHTNRYA